MPAVVPAGAGPCAELSPARQAERAELRAALRAGDDDDHTPTRLRRLETSQRSYCPRGGVGHPSSEPCSGGSLGITGSDETCP